jgi:FkbH-like protein
MFEFNQYDRRLHTASAARPELPYAPYDNVAKLSLMYWWEHCTECAAPACYTTCDLYEARADTRCRRFRFGVYKNRNFPSLRGYGAEVAFKKWGVIGATGNTAMESRASLRWKERILEAVTMITDATGAVLARLLNQSRWHYLTDAAMRHACNWLHRKNSRRTAPDAFILEMYNPGEQPVRMQLAMEYAPEAVPKLVQISSIRPRFRTTVTLPPGYSRHEFEKRLFQGVTDTGLPFQIAFIPEADTAPTLVFLSADFVQYREKMSAEQNRPGVKCVVWDLDNTIWDGILVEDDKVALKPGVKEILSALDERGILHSVVSKNDHESAWRMLELMGISEYFLYPQINWRPKSENIREIADKLNIGIDTLAFVDDNPHELDQVSGVLPEVICIDARNVDDLLSNTRLKGSDTADARNRRRYYREAIMREEKQEEFGQDYLRFLEHCEIQLEIGGYRCEDFDRVAELAQRTNQLNFSGHKYDRDQLRQILDDSSVEKYSLSCSDKYGSYGLIGFGLVRRSHGQIEVRDLMLSCRVQGKMIENAFFTHLETHHNPEGCSRLLVHFQETKRNQPARQALEAAHMTRIEAGSGYTREIRKEYAGEAGIIQVQCAAVTASSLEATPAVT